MQITSLTTVSFLTLFSGCIALPITSTTAATVNVFDLSTSRVNTTLKELLAEMSNIFLVSPSEWGIVASRITQRADAVAKMTKSGAAQMRAAPALGQVESLALWSPVQAMTTTSNEVLAKFIQMKSIVFQMQNGQRAILGILTTYKECAAEFTTAMSSKLPLLYKYVGELYGNTVGTQAANAIKEYQKPPPQRAPLTSAPLTSAPPISAPLISSAPLTSSGW